MFFKSEDVFVVRRGAKLVNGNDFVVDSESADDGLGPACFFGADERFQKSHGKQRIRIAQNLGAAEGQLTIFHKILLSRGIFRAGIVYGRGIKFMKIFGRKLLGDKAHF